MTDFTWPQPEDKADAANFAFADQKTNVDDYVETGLSFTVDYSVPSFDTSAGKAIITDTDAESTRTGEIRNEVAYAVWIDARSGISLTDNDLNHIWLEANSGTDDSPQITVNTTGSEPSSDSLKIGEIDTSANTSTQFNRAPAGRFQSFGFSTTDTDQFSINYDSGNDQLVVEDVANGLRQLEFSKGGDLTIPSGGLYTNGTFTFDSPDTSAIWFDTLHEGTDNNHRISIGSIQDANMKESIGLWHNNTTNTSSVSDTDPSIRWRHDGATWFASEIYVNASGNGSGGLSGGDRVATRTWTNSNYVDVSGDTMSGLLKFDSSSANIAVGHFNGSTALNGTTNEGLWLRSGTNRQVAIDLEANGTSDALRIRRDSALGGGEADEEIFVLDAAGDFDAKIGAIYEQGNRVATRGQAIPLSITHANWEDGLSNEEIQRIEVPSGKVLEVYSLDLQMKGGGSSTSLSVDVYDATNSTSLVSDSAGGGPTTGSPAGTSGDGATVLVRISNSTGSAQDASLSGSFYLV